MPFERRVFFFSGHNSHTFLCRPWLIVFGPRPPRCKSPHFTMLHGRDMFLVSDSCSLLNHVKPQPCVLVLAYQAARSTVRACLTSRFHALSASKLANSCVFHQKWFLEKCAPHLSLSGGGGWQDQADREAGLQLNMSCASYSVVQPVHRFGRIMHIKHDGQVETTWRRSAWPVGARPIRVFS